jgi:hypothetical protein
MVPSIRDGQLIMHTLPNWAWWIIAAGLLLSPVFAFLLALLVEIVIDTVKEGGAPAMVAVITASLTVWSLRRRVRARQPVKGIVEDQA